MIPEKEAAGRRLWADYEHYMGLNFDVFFEINEYMSPFLFPVESNDFTGVFCKRLDNISLRFLPLPAPQGIARPSCRGLPVWASTVVSIVSHRAPRGALRRRGIARGGIGAGDPIAPSESPDPCQRVL
jgi:hypothetical protein